MVFSSIREEVEIKGVALRSLFEVLEDRYGAGITKEVRSAMPDDLREALDDPPLASKWYPIAIYRAVHQAAQVRLTRGTDLARSLAQEAVGRDFKGVYRLLTGTLKPEWLLAWVPRQYGRYFRGGEVRIEEVRSGYARIALNAFVGFDRSLWMDMMGSCEAILLACGATHLRARIKDQANEDDAVLEFFWV